MMGRTKLSASVLHSIFQEKTFGASKDTRNLIAGFELEVVNTASAGHAKKLAASVDFSTCPDGIICVGGDEIVNEGRLTATHVFAVEWIHNGEIHFGMTVAYFGFISDDN